MHLEKLKQYNSLSDLADRNIARTESLLSEARLEIQYPQIRNPDSQPEVQRFLQLSGLVILYPRIIELNREDKQNLDAEFRRLAGAENSKGYYEARAIRDERVAELSRTLPVEVAEMLPVVQECDKWLGLCLYDYESPEQILAKLTAFQAWLDAQKISEVSAAPREAHDGMHTEA